MPQKRFPMALIMIRLGQAPTVRGPVNLFSVMMTLVRILWPPGSQSGGKVPVSMLASTEMDRSFESFERVGGKLRRV